ncbi:MAG: hypothetical protein EA353_07150 [Puniceicoccaceae bacterium]|nr:MAG: hypothetical protein EA353_07150 [Puniceicoccaceae bacterium]
MGKRKPKKRKNKLARPPKRRASPPMPVFPPFPVDDEAAFLDAGLDELDAPMASPRLPKNKQPRGAVDPSLYESARYKTFRDSVAAIRASLPESVEKFATYDLPDLKDRRWLARYCIKKEAGELPGWQQVILEKAGFNWVRGRPPEPKRKKAKKAGPSIFDIRWQESYAALREVCSTGAAAEFGLLGLLHGDEVHYDWVRRQIVAAKAGKLSQQRLEQLRALPFDFELVKNDPGFTQWRKSFRQYAAGEMTNAARWEAHQSRARRAGKMPEWRIRALDTLGFNWVLEVKVRPPAAPKKKVDAQKNMEDRWRARLAEYLELQAEHGKSGQLPLYANASLRPWISRMRMRYKKGQLSPELVKEFTEQGFNFDGKAVYLAQWNEFYQKLCAFKQRFGHLRVPIGYCDDPALGRWFANQQECLRNGRLKGEKLAKLKALGVPPRQRTASSKMKKSNLSIWLRLFREVEAILQAEHGGRMPEFGAFSVPHKSWMKREAKKLKAGTLEPWQVEHLQSIGFDPDKLPERPPQVDWADRLERLRRFIQEHGHAQVPRGYTDKKLNAFVDRIRMRKRKGDLNLRELSELRAVGFVFSPNREVSPAWRREYESLKAFYEKHGHSDVPRSFPENQGLAEYVAQQRQRGRKGRLLAEHIRLLDALNFRWIGEHPVGKDVKDRA